MTADVSDEQAAYDIVSSTRAFFPGRVIEVRTDDVRMPHGSVATRDVVVHPGAVGVIALDGDRVLLLRQYRHPVRRMLWEPPAGLLDKSGEPPLEAAKRELYEEAHCRADRWDVLVDAFTSPGMSDEAVRIYLARDVTEIDDRARFEGEHEERDMETRWVPLEEAVSRVLAGRLHNPLAIMGLLAAATVVRNGFSGLRPADTPWPERPAGR